MLHKYLAIAATPSVKAAQEFYGSRKSYARMDEGSADDIRNERIGPIEAQFIAVRDSFYLASVSETGWPYMQFRGGPRGFLHVLDEKTLGYADFRGNRQYITTGNVSKNDRVSLFLMDYPNQRRLKIFARAEIKQAGDAADLVAKLKPENYDAKIERAVLFHVEAFDWNCPQHITPRFTQAELQDVLVPIADKIASLEAELADLRARIAASKTTAQGI